MKQAPKFLLSNDEGEIFITHTQKPLLICKLLTYHDQVKAIEVIVSCDEFVEEKRLEALKKRMLDWYIFKHHNNEQTKPLKK